MLVHVQVQQVVPQVVELIEFDAGKLLQVRMKIGLVKNKRQRNDELVQVALLSLQEGEPSFQVLMQAVRAEQDWILLSQRNLDGKFGGQHSLDALEDG